MLRRRGRAHPRRDRRRPGGRDRRQHDFTSALLSGGFRIGYKNALSGRLALFGGDLPSSVGAELGVVVSALADGGPLVPFAGARIAAALPIDDDIYADGGLRQTLVIPIGLTRRLDAHWQGLIELGGIGALSEARGVLDRMIDAGDARRGGEPDGDNRALVQRHVRRDPPGRPVSSRREASARRSAPSLLASGPVVTPTAQVFGVSGPA